MNMQNLARATALGLSAVIASGCATAPRVDPDVAKGRQQLVDALDAGWIRVVASGKDRQILASQPPSNPGAALSYMVTLADCLPQPDIAPFPEKPVGLLKEILDRGTIRQVVQTTTNTPNDTAFFFSSISDAQFQAVLDEINAHYKVNLKVENVVVPPGPMPSTSLVVEGKADIVSQLNATGGDTQGMRRRTSRRFTCTMSAISQYIHIPAKSPLAKEINTVDDLSKRKGLRICTGPAGHPDRPGLLPAAHRVHQIPERPHRLRQGHPGRQGRPHHQPAAGPVDRRPEGLQVGAHADCCRHATLDRPRGHPVPVRRQPADRGQVLQSGMTAGRL